MQIHTCRLTNTAGTHAAEDVPHMSHQVSSQQVVTLFTCPAHLLSRAVPVGNCETCSDSCPSHNDEVGSLDREDASPDSF